MEQKLHFSDEDAMYILLNIIAHDVIHDYGPAGGTEQRWKNNQIIVKQFTNDYYTFTNPLTGGDPNSSKKIRTDSGSSTIVSDEISNNETIVTNIPGTNIHNLNSEPRRIVKAKKPLFPGTGQMLGETPRLNYAMGIINSNDELSMKYDNYLNTLNEIVANTNNTIIFTFFNHYLLFSKFIQLKSINFENTQQFIVPLGFSDANYNELYKDISNKFIGYCYLNKINNNLPYTEYLDLLCTFLSSDSIKQSIFENIEFMPLSTGIKRKNYTGGYTKGGAGDTKLNYEESTNIINDFNELNKSQNVVNYLNTLDSIYRDYTEKEGNILPESKNMYENTRKLLINEYQKVFLKYEQNKKSGSLYGNLDILPLIKLRFTYRKVILIENFFNVIKTVLLDYYGIIEEYNITQQKIKEKLERQQLSEETAAQKQLEKEEKQRLSDLLASQQGDLTSMDKEVRQQFSTFIARSGLFLTNVCNEKGVVNKNVSPPINSALRKEINILLYIAEWTTNTGWQEIKNQSLDDELIDYFIDNFQEIKGRYVCQQKLSYVVNNAAPINSDLKNLSFCPYSSILDGMSQCSWNSAQGNIEYGNMNFYITNNNENMYYNGQMTINEPKSTNNVYPTNLNLSFNVKLKNFTIRGNKNTTINGVDLEAHFVLKNTLVNIINYILSLDDNLRSVIFSGGNIFNNLFNYYSKNVNLFNVVYSEILFKGTGDLFQEINCVSKFGGYTMSNYKINNSILSYKTSNGDQLRFFAANDRPSGTRFIYMLLKGNPKEINTKSMGGYYSKEKMLIVKRPENLKNCEIVPVMKGGKHKKRVTKRSYKKNRIPRNRFTKRYKK